jgi:hypothetical protein
LAHAIKRGLKKFECLAAAHEVREDGQYRSEAYIIKKNWKFNFLCIKVQGMNKKEIIIIK